MLAKGPGSSFLPETQCDRPSLPPGVYFRLLMLGYFEGVDSERGIAWRVADSLTLRAFLGYELTDPTPDHSTLAKTRVRPPVELHQEVFNWMLGHWSGGPLFGTNIRNAPR